MRDAIASAQAWGGEIDVLIYNAAAMHESMASLLTFEAFVADAAINIGGALTSVSAVLPSMRARRFGTILFTGGGLALEPYPAWSALAAGKAALRSYAIALHKEVGADNVQVAVISICGIIEPGGPFDPNLIADRYWELHATAAGRRQRELVYLPTGADPYYSDPQAIYRSASRPIQV
jgi:NAD(P)-dependent dehydrogenase (short-subunit alcohol dehydrogenase family)